MEIEFLTNEDLNWYNTIEYTKKCPWKAGPYLSKLMIENNFKDYERVVIIKDNNEIFGFCTITKEDCIENCSYYPFIGFIYIDEKYQGNRYSEQLINACSRYLVKNGFDKVYITTDHLGLYEKYGFKFIEKKMSKFNNLEQIFVKDINIYIPDKIKEIVKDLNYKYDNIGRSKDIVIQYEDKYVLKISEDKNILKREYEINNILPYSKSLVYMEEENYAYYLRTYLKGTSLIDERFLNNPELLVTILVDVVKTLYSLDTKNIQIRSTDNIGNSFIHGDLCLPNILVDEDNKLVGFIDLGNAGLGDPWYDLSWLLWSLEYNLKTNKYNNLLLNKLNIEFNEEKYNLYIPEEYRKQ